MKKSLLIASLLAVAASGCSLLPASVERFEETAANALVESSERTICRNIPVGTWMRLYGANAARREAWRALCTTAQATPASDAQAAR